VLLQGHRRPFSDSQWEKPEYKQPKTFLYFAGKGHESRLFQELNYECLLEKEGIKEENVK